MRVEVLRAYGQYRKGEIIPDMAGNVARTLIARGFVAERPASAMPAPTQREMRGESILRRKRG